MDFKDLKDELDRHRIPVNVFAREVGPFPTARKKSTGLDKERGRDYQLRKFGKNAPQMAQILAVLSRLTGVKHRLAWIKSDLEGNTEIVKVIEHEGEKH